MKEIIGMEHAHCPNIFTYRDGKPIGGNCIEEFLGIEMCIARHRIQEETPLEKYVCVAYVVHKDDGKNYPFWNTFPIDVFKMPEDKFGPEVIGPTAESMCSSIMQTVDDGVNEIYSSSKVFTADTTDEINDELRRMSGNDGGSNDC